MRKKSYAHGDVYCNTTGQPLNNEIVNYGITAGLKVMQSL